MRTPPFLPITLPARLSLAAIVVLGLALRIASARGGLWIDEAWSAVLVARVSTPLDVFVSINHDNNHYLNSLWMQALGFGANPLALRAPSIVAGTLTILVTAAIGARRSARHALVAALLFAVSPILVNYGSEARGYAPMLLAAMTAILVVLRWLDRNRADSAIPRRVAWSLGALTLAGLLAQLTMLFVTVAIGAWVGMTLRRTLPPRDAARATLRVMSPSIVAVLLVFALLLGAAAASSTGLQVGDYTPFTLTGLRDAVGTMIATTLGITALAAWTLAVVALALLATVAADLRRRGAMAWFHAVAIVGLPIGFVVLQVGNSGIPRYYLLSSIAILLLVGDGIADLLGRTRLARLGGAALLVLLTIGSLQSIRAETAHRRSDIDAAIVGMRDEAPAARRSTSTICARSPRSGVGRHAALSARDRRRLPWRRVRAGRPRQRRTGAAHDADLQTRLSPAPGSPSRASVGHRLGAVRRGQATPRRI